MSLVGGPLALLAASTAGYLLAGAALGPVEAMRRRADDVSGDEPGARLPLPEANDEIRRLGTTLNENEGGGVVTMALPLANVQVSD